MYIVLQIKKKKKKDTPSDLMSPR